MTGFIAAGMGEVAAQLVGSVAADTLRTTYPNAATVDLRAIDIHEWTNSGPGNPAALALGKKIVSDRLTSAERPDSYGVLDMNSNDQTDVLAGCLVTAMIAGAILRGEEPVH